LTEEGYAMRERKPEQLLVGALDAKPLGLGAYAHLDRRLRALGHAGVGPDATSREIRELLFDLMAGGTADHEDRTAWDALRLPERRLIEDFFMYALRQPASDETAMLQAAAGEPVRPLPVKELLSIGVAPGLFDELFPSPPSAPGTAPEFGRFAAFADVPLDLGELDWDPSDLVGELW
jgi:hypothetical protein